MESLTQVDFSPLITALVSLLATVLTAVSGYGIRYLAQKLNLAQTDQLTMLLETATNAGINFAANKLTEAGKDLSNVDVKNELVATAANYVAAVAPQAIKKFKIGEQLTSYIEARVVEHPAIPTAFSPNS